MPMPTHPHILPAGVILLVLILLSGYSIVRPSIPGWWIWAYWANPFAWAFRAVATNEFLRPRWGFPVLDGAEAGMRAGNVRLCCGPAAARSQPVPAVAHVRCAGAATFP